MFTIKKLISVSPAHTLLAITLMTIQMSKRLYESHFVNVFSDAKMNLVQYIMSFIHYIFVVAVIVGESDIFVKGRIKKTIINKSILSLYSMIKLN